MKLLKSRRALTVALAIALATGFAATATSSAKSGRKVNRAVIASALVTMSALAVAGFDVSIFQKGRH